MKLYRLILILVLVTTVCCGQKATVEGLVFNKATNEPISFALVYSTDSIIYAQTDFDGKFKIKHAKAGTYNLLVSSFPNFAIILVKGITVPENGKLKLSFPMQAIEIKTVEKIDGNICPICKSNSDVVPITYGMVEADMIIKQQRRETILGGCLFWWLNAKLVLQA